MQIFFFLISHSALCSLEHWTFILSLLSIKLSIFYVTGAGLGTELAQAVWLLPTWTNSSHRMNISNIKGVHREPCWLQDATFELIEEFWICTSISWWIHFSSVARFSGWTFYTFSSKWSAYWNFIECFRKVIFSVHNHEILQVSLALYFSKWISETEILKQCPTLFWI